VYSIIKATHIKANINIDNVKHARYSFKSYNIVKPVQEPEQRNG